MKPLLCFSIAALAFGCSDESSSARTETTVVEFLNLRVESVTATRAVARFETSVPTTCAVSYGDARDSLTLTAVDPDMAEGEVSADHQVPLEDLLPETQYFWQGVVEVDGAELRSAVQSFETSEGMAQTDLVNFATGCLQQLWQRRERLKLGYQQRV